MPEETSRVISGEKKSWNIYTETLKSNVKDREGDV